MVSYEEWNVPLRISGKVLDHTTSFVPNSQGIEELREATFKFQKDGNITDYTIKVIDGKSTRNEYGIERSGADGIVSKAEIREDEVKAEGDWDLESCESELGALLLAVDHDRVFTDPYEAKDALKEIFLRIRYKNWGLDHTY